MTCSRRQPLRTRNRVRRVRGHFVVPNTSLVLVVEDGKIVTVKRLEWIR